MPGILDAVTIDLGRTKTYARRECRFAPGHRPGAGGVAPAPSPRCEGRLPGRAGHLRRRGTAQPRARRPVVPARVPDRPGPGPALRGVRRGPLVAPAVFVPGGAMPGPRRQARGRD